jgi:hypothetical protein
MGIPPALLTLRLEELRIRLEIEARENEVRRLASQISELARGGPSLP